MGQAKDLNEFFDDKKELDFYDKIEFKLFKERTLFLCDEIDEAETTNLIKKIILLDSINNKPIKLFINSCGGSSYDALALYDVMRKCKSPIHTVALGKAMSAAAWILLAGTNGKRSAYAIL